MTHGRKISENKVGMLKLAEKPGNASEACKEFLRLRLDLFAPPALGRWLARW